MPELSVWVGALKPYKSEAAVSAPNLPQIAAVRFVKHMDKPSADTVYIGSADETYEAIQREKSCCRGATFFASGSRAGLLELAREYGANAVVTDMDILDIHDRLSGVMRQYQNWSRCLLEATSKGDIHYVVNEAAEIAGMPLYLLNSRFRLVFSSEAHGVADPIAEELIKNGWLSKESEKMLMGEDWGSRNEGPNFIFRRLPSGNVCWIQKVIKDNKIISTMLMFAPESRDDFDAATILEMIRESISRIMQMPGGAEYWTEADFKTLLDDIISQRLTDEQEISRRFSLISRTPQRYCTFIIMEFSSPSDLAQPLTHLFTLLEEIFPDSNAALYNDTVVLLLSRPDRVFQPTPIFDNERFSALLTRYNAYAAISNATSRRGMFRTNYLICKSILQLAKSLCPNSQQRFFFFEDYAEYFMIDLCINSFCALLGHDDIIYLTHPDAIALARYDKDNDTNLLDVLYHYCLNNCNMVQTAKSAYMHRNTVAGKIAKIQEIIHSDLSNVQTQQRMIFSYKILRYYDKYAKINLKERLNVAPPPAYDII